MVKLLFKKNDNNNEKNNQDKEYITKKWDEIKK